MTCVVLVLSMVECDTINGNAWPQRSSHEPSPDDCGPLSWVKAIVMMNRHSYLLRGLRSYGPNAPQNALRGTLAFANRRFNSSQSGASEFGKTHVARGLGRLSNAVIEHGKGSYITLKDDRGRYLDFTTGIGVTGLGADANLSLVSPS